MPPQHPQQRRRQARTTPTEQGSGQQTLLRRPHMPRFPRYQRNVYLLLLFTLGKGFQLSIAQLSINLYAYSLGYKLDFIGLLTATPAIGALLASVPVGLLADRVSRKPLLIVSGLLNPVALAVVALSANAPFLLAASLANGILSSAYWVTNVPILSESSSDEQRVSVMALNSFLLLGIGALGGLVGGIVPEVVAHFTGLPALSVIPLRWGVLSASIIVFLPAIPLFWLRDLPRNAPRTQHQQGADLPMARGLADEATTPAQMAAPLTSATGRTTATADALQIAGAGQDDAPGGAQRGAQRGWLRGRSGRWALVAIFVMLLLPDLLESTGQGAVVGLLQLFFHLRFALGPGALGVLSATAGLLCGVMALSAPRIVRRYGKLRTITSVQFLLAPVVLLIGFSPLFAFSALAEFGRNTLRGIFEPVYATFAMERVSPRHRSTLAGFYSLTWSVGNSIGPAVAGWLQLHVGLSAAFVIGAACEALAGACLLLFFRHTPGVD